MDKMSWAAASLFVVLLSFAVATISNETCSRSDTKRHIEDVTDLLQIEATASFASERALRLRAASKPASDTGNRQVLKNSGDAQYILYMNIAGEEGIAGIPDTGSFELVVFPDTCTSCGKAAKFNLRRSKTYKAGTVRENFQYGSGDLDCKLSSDVISMGPLPPKRQGAWFVEKAKMSLLYNAAFNAIVGVGPPETPSVEAWDICTKSKLEVAEMTLTSAIDGESKSSELASKEKTTQEQCHIAEEIDKHPAMIVNYGIKKFSLCLGRKLGSDGYLVWNDDMVDTYPNRFKHVPVTGKSEWSTALTDVTLRYPQHIEKLNISKGDWPVQCHNQSCVGLLDSGTSLVAMPKNIISKLQEDMKALDSECSNYDIMPTLTFNLAGNAFTLDPRSYIGKINGEGPAALAGKHLGSNCQLMVMDSDDPDSDQPLWIFGMPFFREYYTTFKTGMSAKERSLYIARAGDDCSPVDPQAALVDAGSTQEKLPLRTIEGSLILTRAKLGRRSTSSGGRTKPKKDQSSDAAEGKKHQVITTVLQSQ